MSNPNPLKEKIGRFTPAALITYVSVSSAMMMFGGCATLSEPSEPTALSAAANIPFGGNYSALTPQQTKRAAQVRQYLQTGELGKMTQLLASSAAFSLIGQKQPDIYDPYQEAAYKLRGAQKTADATFNHYLNRNMLKANPGLSLKQIQFKLQLAFVGMPFEKSVPLQLLLAGVNPMEVSKVSGQSLESLNEELTGTLVDNGLASPYNPTAPTFRQRITSQKPAPEKAIQGMQTR